MLDKNGSNFEVRKPGQSILVGWDENGVEKACLYDVKTRNILISLQEKDQITKMMNPDCVNILACSS